MSKAVIEKAIKIKLKEYADLDKKLGELNDQHDKETQSLFPDEIRVAWDALEVRQTTEYKFLADLITEALAEIKEQTLKLGSTVTGESHQAVFSKGRESWMTKELDGYAQAHPEIKRFKKVGKPSISIRAVKKEKEENDG